MLAHSLFALLLVQSGRTSSPSPATQRSPETRPAPNAPTAGLDPLARIQQAKALLEAGKYERVLSIVDALLREYPKSQSSHLLRALALDELSRFNEARKSYEAALRIAPGDPQIEARLGMHFVRTSAWTDAIPHLERSLEATGPEALLLFYLAQAYSHIQDKPRALSTIEKCVALDPRNPTMLLKLGEYQAQAGKHSPALETLLRVQKLNADEPGLDAALGNVYLSLLEVEPARAALERATARDPKNPAVLSALAEACSKARDHAAARMYYQRVLDLGFDDARYRLGLGAALLGLGENEAAIVSLNEAVRLNPRLEEAHFHLARAYQAAGHAEESRRELRLFQTLKANPINPLEERNEFERSLWQKAEALVKDGKEEEALQFLTRGDRKINSPEFLIGALYYTQGRYADAQRLLLRALETSPDIPSLRAYLGLARLELGQLGEAEAAITADLQRSPREPIVIMAMGRLNFRKENWKDAERYLVESRVVETNVLLMLCEAQLRQGRRKEAEDTAAVIRTLTAGEPDTLAAVQRLLERFEGSGSEGAVPGAPSPGFDHATGSIHVP